MKKKKKKPINPVSDHIIVTNKQIRWIECRQLAENFYHSTLTDEEITAVLYVFKTQPQLIFSILNLS